MLPDWPGTKSGLRRRINDIFSTKVRKLTPLADASRSVVHEGNGTSIQRPSEDPEQTKMLTASADFAIAMDEVEFLTLDALLNRMDQAALSMAKQMSEHVFRTIEEVTTRTGNVVDFKGQGFSAEGFLEVCRKVEMDFKDGRPVYPTLTVSPQQEERVRAELARILSEPKLASEFASILAEKREAWNDREASRSLVG